jgi:hypothetical protein
VRFASTPAASVSLGKASLKWQGVVCLFTQNYDQNAVNTFGPFVLSQFIGSAVDQHSPLAALDDTGVGLYGHGVVAFGDRMDLTVGARFDHENRKANLQTFFDPAIAPPVTVDAEQGFSNVSPQLAFAYKVRRLDIAYVVHGRLRRGFRPPAGSGAGEERRGTWRRFQERVGRPPRDDQPLGLLDRLDRPAAEQAESAGAGAVLHLERRRRAQQRRRGRGERPRP